MKKEYVLCIDKKGEIADRILPHLSPDYFCVVLSGKKPSLQENVFEKDVLHVSYRQERKSMPLVPQYPYAFIIVVYEGQREIKEGIRELVSDARVLGAHLIVVLEKRNWDEELAQVVVNSYDKGYVFVFGDCFDETGGISEESVSCKLISGARLNRRITLSENGMGVLYPVYTRDAVALLLEKGFSKEGKRGVFYLFPKEGITELAFSRILQKKNPLVGVDFAREVPIKEDPPIHLRGTWLTGEEYPLGERIGFVLFAKTNKGEKEASLLDKKDPVRSPHSSFSVKAFLFAAFLSLFFFTLLPPLVVLGSFYGGKQQFAIGLRTLKNGQLNESEKEIVRSHLLFSVAEKISPVFLVEANVLGQKERSEAFMEELRLSQETSKSLVSSYNIIARFHDVIAGRTASPQKVFFEILKNAKEQLAFFQKAKALEKDSKETFGIPRLLGESAQGEGLIDVFPYLFGFDRKKTYLVLMQNNLKIRPSGGAISAYALIDFENGKMSKPSFGTVYSADNKLKGHVEPPFALKRYAGAVHWYLRDSNFYVDFVSVASRAAFFAKEEMGIYPDGVIAVDGVFIKKLLRITGPVHVNKVGEISENSFFEKLMSKTTETEKEKDEMINEVFSAVIKKTLAKNVPFLRILEAIFASVEEKHILFAHLDEDIQESLTLANVSSSLRDIRREEENKFLDFIAVIDADVGTVSAVTNIKRSFDYGVSVSQNKNWISKLSIFYENKKENQDRGGHYKNYVRVISPFGSQLSAIAIDGKNQQIIVPVVDQQVYEKSGFISQGLEVEKTILSNKNLFGFFIEVPSGSSRAIEIEYVLPFSLTGQSDDFSYNLRVFKQPGTEDDMFRFSLTHPVEYEKQFYLGSENVLSQQNKLSYTTSLSADRDLMLRFIKK
ncbi:MAG: hypothetical protein A3B53_02905 [Candidatus Levybacteria bacterium RIFCSPLOWO2_01_FULL_42_15]|nr:MAG: hypothetical protein A3B53_02905 [Candidatus Levybacteria bacterium RIFCSPLOWO2_01_FULL_42_15]